MSSLPSKAEPDPPKRPTRMRALLDKLRRVDRKTVVLIAGLVALQVVVVLFIGAEHGIVYLIPLNIALLAIAFGAALKRP